MTDEQIIMGLKCCYLGEADCKECPFDTFEDCNDVLMAKYVIDLINRQQAEIERLNAISDRLNTICTNQDLEIERLINIKADELEKAGNKCFDAGYHYGIIKFAERLTDRAELIKANAFDSKWAISQDDIDNLVKEMTEGCENG